MPPAPNTSARMIKLATGVALTSCSTGASSTSAVCHACAATASTMLTATPSPKPSRMRPELKPTRCQNSACGKKLQKERTACTGETRNTSCPTAMAAHCHTASRRPQRPAAEKILFMSLHKLYLLLITK